MSSLSCRSRFLYSRIRYLGRVATALCLTPKLGYHQPQKVAGLEQPIPDTSGNVLSKWRKFQIYLHLVPSLGGFITFTCYENLQKAISTLRNKGIALQILPILWLLSLPLNKLKAANSSAQLGISLAMRHSYHT